MAGRLAAAIACPCRFSFSSGMWNRMRSPTPGNSASRTFDASARITSPPSPVITRPSTSRLRTSYEVRNLLVLGRVMTGEGGDVILAEASKVLEAEFPGVGERIRFHIPDEKEKRHGQAIAAASLPAIQEKRNAIA